MGLLRRLFGRSLDEVIVDSPDNLVEPSPIARDGLEDDGIAMAPDSNLARVEAELFRKTDRPGAAGPADLCGFHRPNLHES